MYFHCGWRRVPVPLGDTGDLHAWQDQGKLVAGPRPHDVRHERHVVMVGYRNQLKVTDAAFGNKRSCPVVAGHEASLPPVEYGLGPSQPKGEMIVKLPRLLA